ncbi:MAG: YggT family protein [Halomonas sp.]|uniref:YggT family protein n=1 Tax=Halomonas sp. TaxID=1486246 RepID=UPI003F92034F
MGSNFAGASLLLVNTAVNFYLLLLMLRFLLQASRADYFNPISQSVVKITQPVVRPFQGFLKPLMGRFDLATLVSALLIKMIVIIAILVISGFGMPPVTQLLIAAIATLASTILKIYFFALIAMIILSWVAPQSGHPAAMLVMQLVRPIMTPVQRVIPPLGMIDLSPIVVFIAINLIDSIVVGRLIRASGALAALVGF